ncbi:polysaccharide deacetylase family protein [Streptomyces sp. NTH33]|uniref:polysaccharide deacetylase family protein n=1 Tax=Streptomyces sp. NTH33 TaxID=1735453 RepID=UPI000DAA673E|nr:polysaccharide deacetylase family protein [Streptomyces sp. NTH33]PZG93648.1 polysaccharide deacetylase family protein [Streptomyces sp. NTH33]
MGGPGSRAVRTTAAALAPVAAVAAAHIVPAATWLPRFRALCFPRLAGTGHPDHIALTFDDGPDPACTPHFLDELDRLAVRATFFVLGERVARYPGLTRHMAERGHELAVHGWTHSRPWLPAPGRDLRETARAADVLHDTTGRRPHWYRPPYGILTSGRWAAARRAGLRPVLWTAWGRDWTPDATPAAVHTTVTAGLRGGGTILLHDSDHASSPGSWRITLAALPALITTCHAAGWTVGPLSDHGLHRSRRT